jgi:hypothetical protein
MDSSGIIIITGILAAAGGVLTIIHHKHIRAHLKSKCCEKESNIDFQLDGSPVHKIDIREPYQQPEYKVKISDRPMPKMLDG